MAKQLFLVLIICSFAFAGFTQTVHGKIVDSASHKPIGGASVYINGSYIGATSKADGTFQFDVQQEKVPVIVSHVGYETQIVINYIGKDLLVELKPREKTLHEVTIGAMSREDEMKIFKREFIGSISDKECVIENPDDIYFTYNKKKDSLVAKSERPLQITNKRLGYKVTYFLVEFNYTPRNIFYNGNFFFKEDTAGLAASVVKAMKRRRDDAYFGSRMHFIRALWHRNLEKNGFELSNASGMLCDTDVLAKHQQDLFLYPQKLVFITYGVRKSSVISIAPESASYITAEGYYNANVGWGGFMAESRVNMLLPYEFKPSKSEVD